MSQRAKLLQKIRNNPRGVSFDELDKVLQWYGFELRGVRGSHHAYRHRQSRTTLIVVRRRASVQPDAVRDVLEAIDKLGDEE
jgi:predicted RNA binding protein YcfA (HicA-like mRNA interferase family)